MTGVGPFSIHVLTVAGAVLLAWFTARALARRVPDAPYRAAGSMAIDAAFCKAVRVTFAGSMTPAAMRSSNFSVAALKPYAPSPSMTLHLQVEHTPALHE